MGRVQPSPLYWVPPHELNISYRSSVHAWQQQQQQREQSTARHSRRLRAFNTSQSAQPRKPTKTLPPKSPDPQGGVAPQRSSNANKSTRLGFKIKKNSSCKKSLDTNSKRQAEPIGVSTFPCKTFSEVSERGAASIKLTDWKWQSHGQSLY